MPPPTAALEPLLAIITRVVEGPAAAAAAGLGVGTAALVDGAGTTAAAAAAAAAAVNFGEVGTLGTEEAEATTREQRLCGRSRSMGADFTELLVASGAVDALASLFALHDRPKTEVQPVPPAIVAGLRLLEAMLGARAPAPGRELDWGESDGAGARLGATGVPEGPGVAGARGGAGSQAELGVGSKGKDGKDRERGGVEEGGGVGGNRVRGDGMRAPAHYGQKVRGGGAGGEGESPAGSLITALRETALAGLPSLLTSVLLQTESTVKPENLYLTSKTKTVNPEPYILNSKRKTLNRKS